MLHRHQMLITVITGHGEIITLKRGSRRQNDIRVFCRRRPEAFRDHHQLRFLPGTDQAIGILMMSKVGTARPPDKTNIREMSVHTVVLICATRVFQCFNNAGNRDFIHRIAATRQAALHGREHRRTPRGVTTIGKMIRKTKTAAGCADLPQHCCQRDDHPVFLLTKLLALHSPACHQHGGILVENSRQLADFRCANTTNLCRPFGVFRYSVTLAQQIRGEDGITGGATRQKRFVVPTIFHQRMGDPQHQRNIGAHVRCHPLHFIAKEIDGFRSHWINADQLFPAVTQCGKVRKPLLIRCIPRNFQRIEWVSTPQHHDIAMFQHQRPTGLLLINFAATHDIRHDRLCRTGRIIPQMPGITACQRHIAL